MGFDVLYLPPIHPIGTTNRKGAKNNPISAERRPRQSLGHRESGGRPQGRPSGTGNTGRLARLRNTPPSYGIEIALDMAFQGSPDHPYVREHPEWFRHRPDGSIQYAENPPKKYEDIYPFDFESTHWRELWEELKSVVLFWLEQGVRIFRVDNPHTKAFAFWEWLIARDAASSIRTSFSWPRRSPVPRSCTGWPSWVSPSPTPTSPGATPSRRSPSI